VGAYSGRARPREAALETPGTEELTEEEKRVLKLLAFGRSVKEMAAELVMPPDMVRGHVQNILVKLGVHSHLDPPPLPPAASAALAVPIQQPEDVPTHVGKTLRQESGPPQH
jgi:DNA-binding NarL/FixJ family response regulator